VIKLAKAFAYPARIDYKACVHGDLADELALLTVT
jgi:hypothetical protein